MRVRKRRKPVDLVASQIEAAGQVEKSSDVNFMDALIEEMNANMHEARGCRCPPDVCPARRRVPLRDKITMTSIKG